MTDLSPAPAAQQTTADPPARPTAGSGPASTAPAAPPAVPAGRALQVALLALLVAMVGNSAAMVTAGEGMRPGLTRSVVLGVARPVDATAHRLWLDRPRRVLGRLFGESPGTGGSPLLAAPHPAPSGSGVPSAAAGGSASPSPPPLPATRRVSPAAPLRLVVAGDSMTEFLGPAIFNAPNAAPRIRGKLDTRYGTGLVRPDFFDWYAEAKRLTAARTPEAVVAMIGGNDGQGMLLPSGRGLREGSPGWTAEYQRRARLVMAAYVRGGVRRVYWVSMPVPRSARLARDYRQLNVAVAAAARSVPGVRYVDVTARLSDGGRYSAYLRDDAGRTVLARARDGIHVTRDGARMAAALVLRAVDADWHVLG